MDQQPVDVCLERLVAEHHMVVYRYAYRLSGSAADAEDLTQQTFLLAQSHLAQLRDLGSARAWLCSILRNAYHKACRQRRPQSAADLDLPVEEIPAEACQEEWFDAERLQRSLGELPEEQKSVLLMYYFEERSYREIAAELQVPLGTVMSRLSRAKSHLKDRLLETELHGASGLLDGSNIDRG
ncbi:MAG: RNA polymerase sigma factor [Pirellulales bacterium]